MKPVSLYKGTERNKQETLRAAERTCGTSSNHKSNQHFLPRRSVHARLKPRARTARATRRRPRRRPSESGRRAPPRPASAGRGAEPGRQVLLCGPAAAISDAAPAREIARPPMACLARASTDGGRPWWGGHARGSLVTASGET